MALGKGVHVGHEQCTQVLAVVADDGAELDEPGLAHRILDGLRLDVLPAARNNRCRLYSVLMAHQLIAAEDRTRWPML